MGVVKYADNDKPQSKKCKWQFISPFSSNHAHNYVVERLGKELFAYQERLKQNHPQVLLDENGEAV